MQAYAFTKYLGHVKLEINDETGGLEILHISVVGVAVGLVGLIG